MKKKTTGLQDVLFLLVLCLMYFYLFNPLKTEHMNTPLMELIEWNEKELMDAKNVIDNPNDYDIRIVSMADHYYRAHYQVNKKATELLEKERATIEQAYKSGYMIGELSLMEPYANEEASDYYTKTFTNESK